MATITGNGNAKLIAHETVSFVINPEFPFPVKRVHFFFKFHQNIRYFTILLFSTRTWSTIQQQIIIFTSEYNINYFKCKFNLTKKRILNSWLFTLFVYLFLQQSNSLPPKRMPSPSPSNGSTTSSTSLVSEGRKSTTSGGNAQAAKKFGESIINFFSWNQFQID